MENKKLDLRGFACPMPVIKTKDALEETKGDITIKVMVDNDIAVENVTKFAKSQNLEVKSEPVGQDFVITITRGKYGVPEVETEKTKEEKIEFTTQKGQCILITTDKLGKGNDELGAILMKSHIFSLTESKPLPEKIIFLNSGVHLTTINKETVENLKLMQEKGTTIISCGTCLDFYKLKDKVQVGSIGNMYDIVDSLNQAAYKYVI